MTNSINPYERLALNNPTMANSGRLSQVEAAQNFINNTIAEIKGRPDGEVIPRWIEFGNSVMASLVVNQMLGAAVQAFPALYGGLIVGLGKAADGDGRVFIDAWQTAISLKLVSSDLISEMTSLALSHDLPEDFVNNLQPLLD